MFGNSTVLHLLRVSVVLLAKEQTENHRTVRPAGVHHHFTGGNAPPNGEKDTPIETSMKKKLEPLLLPSSGTIARNIKQTCSFFPLASKKDKTQNTKDFFTLQTRISISSWQRRQRE